MTQPFPGVGGYKKPGESMPLNDPSNSHSQPTGASDGSLRAGEGTVARVRSATVLGKGMFPPDGQIKLIPSTPTYEVGVHRRHG